MEIIKDIIIVVTIIGLAILLAIGLTKCEKKHYTDELYLQPIDGYTYLVYDPNTLVIYYQEKDIYGSKGFGYMAPYYSEHGKLCRWIDNKIVEIK